MEEILVRGLCKRFGEKVVLQDFSARFTSGQTTCVMGRSGCGKTTLLNILMGFVSPDAGQVTGVPSHLSAVFQEDRLLEWYTSLENMTFVGCERARALKLLEMVGLGDAADKLPRELSGGMKRRLAAVRTVARGGDLLLLDEPFGGLDETSRALTAKLISDSFADAAMILVTHSPADAELLEAVVDDRPFIAEG